LDIEHQLPIYFVGVGEGVDDLEPFAAKDFATAIAGAPGTAVQTSGNDPHEPADL